MTSTIAHAIYSLWDHARQGKVSGMCGLCRTPQGFRALARCYVTLFIPIFFGPYYANLRLGIGTPFAVIIAIVVHLTMLASHDVYSFLIS